MFSIQISDENLKIFLYSIYFTILSRYLVYDSTKLIFMAIVDQVNDAAHLPLVYLECMLYRVVTVLKSYKPPSKFSHNIQKKYAS